MKKIFFILLIFSTFRLSAQYYDLIVTSKGDSIACFIDSITVTHIHFEMMVNERWLHTNTRLSDCIKYERNSIDKRAVIFVPGSSYIERISASKLKAHYYDLIITTTGDSIACHIDSVTDYLIYFKMKINNNWAHTNTTLNKVVGYKYNAINKKLVLLKPKSSYIEGYRTPVNISDNNLYTSRYLFAPSAFGMDKGMRSYTNYDIFVQDFQFGITDRFSISTGTSAFLNPVYLIPNYTFQINNKSAFAIGDLFLCSTYGDFLYGNLFYGLYTRGSLDNNFTVGAGLWISKLGKDETETIDQGPDPSFIAYKIKITTTSPAFNFSAQVKLSGNTFFITENYWFKINMDAVADLKGPNPSGALYDITIRSEHYAIEETVLAGILGLRLINKKNPNKSWQISSIYVLAHHGDIPDEYQQPGWETYNNKEGGYSFFPIPLISYTKRF